MAAGYGSIESKKAPILSTYTAGEDSGRLAGKSALVMFDHGIQVLNMKSR